MSAFEDEYLSALMSLESAIMQAYNEHPDLSDFDVERALEATITHYVAQIRNTKPRPIRLNPKAAKLAERLQLVGELLLGEAPLTTEGGEELNLGETLDTQELVACLKRIRKSVRFWTKQGGRQGYLNYVADFLLPSRGSA
ncbi:MAG: hypothetical protein D6791_18895 [Chloroflexi bacterium]|nr:MAG: hypothetical protein D6791_18895 [Chloroflexota bacterium]